MRVRGNSMPKISFYMNRFLMPKNPKYCITVFLCLILATSAVGQCTSGSIFWVNGINAPGTLSDTGVILGIDTVIIRSQGSFASGRPGYTSAVTITRGGYPFRGLSTYRGYSFPASTYTYFKLKYPMDSNYIHVWVSDIRGDGFNAEAQRVRGYLAGVAVTATFKDPVNGAYITGGNVINGASNTTSTFQSSMRAFFNGPVDSIVVSQTSFSDYIIATLYARCNIILPFRTIDFSGIQTGDQILLKWVAGDETGFEKYLIERSPDGTNWTTIGEKNLDTQPGEFHTYLFTDPDPIRAGWNFYRIKSADLDGYFTYSKVIRVAFKSGRAAPYISVNPNPFTDQINIHRLNPEPNSYLLLKLYSPQGQELGSWKTQAGTFSIPTQHLQKGIYFLTVSSNAGIPYSFKLIRN